MKKWKVLLAVVLIFSLGFVCAKAGGNKRADRKNTGENERRAVHVNHNMLTPDYWTGKRGTGDKSIRNLSQIKKINQRIYEDLGRGEEASLYNLEAFSRQTSKEQLKAWIKHTEIPKGNYYIDEVPVTAKYWTGLGAKCNLEGVKEKNPVRYGIAVKRGSLRKLPAKDVITDSPKDICYDILQNTEVQVSEPVLILHKSEDHRWLYVMTYYYRGWMEASDVAVCPGKAQWEKYRNPQSFLVVTGNKIKLEKNPHNRKVSELELGMGTVLILAEEGEGPDRIGCRGTLDNYIIKLPIRKDDGSLTEVYEMIPFNRDVSVGYLPYTTNHVICQGFKFLGDRYGWGGMLSSVDCSGLVFSVYRCFGFRLPRDASAQGKIPCHNQSFYGRNIGERKKLLDSLTPGAILQMPGHVMLYLGKSGRYYYVLNSVGQYIPSEGTKAVPIRTVSVNDLTVSRKDGTRWMEMLIRAVEIR